MRRVFSSLVIMSLLATIISTTSCSIAGRKSVEKNIKFNSDFDEMLYLASLAGSSHNTQPWRVERLNDNLVKVYPDFSRHLKVVDPSSRGLYISLGAFVQTFVLAGNSKGIQCNVVLDSLTNQSNPHIVIQLNQGVQSSENWVKRIKERRTLRSSFSRAKIKEGDLSYLFAGENRQNIVCFDASSKIGSYISDNMLKAYISQNQDTAALSELAEWMRFSNKDVLSKRDGLTTSGMELKGFAGNMVRLFFKPEDSKKSSFVNKGVERTAKQVVDCGGWIIIGNNQNNPIGWVEAGMAYTRINLKCRDLMIGFHPMNQIIEVEAYEKEFDKLMVTSSQENDSSSFKVHFIARIGYVSEYPEPVSVRRTITL